MANSEERFNEILQMQAFAAELMTRFADGLVRINQKVEQNGDAINAIAQIQRQNSIQLGETIGAIAQLETRQAEIQAGQDENRAILSQILKRDQERGG